MNDKKIKESRYKTDEQYRNNILSKSKIRYQQKKQNGLLKYVRITQDCPTHNLRYKDKCPLCSCGIS